ncbi:hypothetical protein C7C46_14155 [Streptomyces tateyamensis]|uniref:Uncharacterized protein n=1 Tax=Streptomyces tateyamensis TaxID=565073 RepID=A0A2V4NCR5_9ACTN|nr:hypothetical protein [Streptomyces tateyamensis]PYC79504.1 hypothetical protein C7C46_14155 [Streptomyces tateyamensis]
MSLDTPAAATPSDGLSRRHLMRQAAAIGAAGLAVTLAGGAAPAAADDGRSEDQPAGPAPVDHFEPMIVHLRDARTGRLDLFSGDRHHRVQDPELAAALVRALG